jgi:hypothetical protein
MVERLSGWANATATGETASAPARSQRRGNEFMAVSNGFSSALSVRGFYSEKKAGSQGKTVRKTRPIKDSDKVS